MVRTGGRQPRGRGEGSRELERLEFARGSRRWVFGGGRGRVWAPGLSQPQRRQREPQDAPPLRLGLSAFPGAKCAHGLKIKTLS